MFRVFLKFNNFCNFGEDSQTDQQTDRPTDLGIKAPSRSLKTNPTEFRKAEIYLIQTSQLQNDGS